MTSLTKRRLYISVILVLWAATFFVLDSIRAALIISAVNMVFLLALMFILKKVPKEQVPAK